MRRGCRTCQMIDPINLHHVWLNDIMAHKLKIGMPHPMLDIPSKSSKQGIEHSHLMPHQHQSINQMRANKSCSSSYKNSLLFRRIKIFDGRKGRIHGERDAIIHKSSSIHIQGFQCLKRKFGFEFFFANKLHLNQSMGYNNNLTRHVTVASCTRALFRHDSLPSCNYSLRFSHKLDSP